MNAIVFPFTWISSAQLSALEAFSVRPAVFLPSDRGIAEELLKWHEAGRIDLAIPVKGDGDRMAHLLRDYQGWADAHRGADISLSRIMEGKIPFFDEAHVARIRSEIRRGPEKGVDSADPAQRLTRARLFLLIAQQFDYQSREIEQELENLKGVESAMFSELHEGRKPTGPKGRKVSAAAPDTGRFMTEERIRAWSRLYLASEVGETGQKMFVTSSRDVLETVLDAAPDTEGVRSVGVAPDRSDGIDAAVQALMAGHTAPAVRAGDGPKMTVFSLPEIPPARFFTRFLKKPDKDEAASGAEEGTLLALLEVPLKVSQ